MSKDKWQSKVICICVFYVDEARNVGKNAIKFCFYAKFIVSSRHETDRYVSKDADAAMGSVGEHDGDGSTYGGVQCEHDSRFCICANAGKVLS